MSDITLGGKNLATLKGQDIPDIVPGNFSCDNNKLTNLEFGPKEVELSYFCEKNNLTSLEFCTIKIGGSFWCTGNSITNLKDIHKQFKNGYIGNDFVLELNPIKSHILGVILIPKLQYLTLDDEVIHNIFNKHLDSERDVLECQEELIQNGFKEFAQL